MNEKKGMMTMNMLIAIILIVIGFAIVFYFFVMFDWTGNINTEVCHQSVIYRATLPSIAGAKEYVPLKCKTNKICITSGFVGGSCKEFENLKGVTKIKVSNVKEIEQIIAREIISCWKMMGEGKVQVFSQSMAEKFAIGNVGSSCVVCNRVAFDREGLEKAGIDLSKIDVMRYMQTHAMPNQDMSYYNYLVGEKGKIFIEEEFKIVDIENVEEKDGELFFIGDEIEVKLEKPTEDTGEVSEIGVLFMQITAPSNLGVFKNYIKLIGGSYAIGFVLKPTTATAALKSPVTWALLAAFGVYQQGATLYNRAVTAGYCGDISIGSEARNGCSVVRMIDYGKEDLSKYCSVIESIP